MVHVASSLFRVACFHCWTIFCLCVANNGGALLRVSVWCIWLWPRSKEYLIFSDVQPTTTIGGSKRLAVRFCLSIRSGLFLMNLEFVSSIFFSVLGSFMFMGLFFNFVTLFNEFYLWKNRKFWIVCGMAAAVKTWTKSDGNESRY